MLVNIPNDIINDNINRYIILEITILLSFEYAQEDLCESGNKDFQAGNNTYQPFIV